MSSADRFELFAESVPDRADVRLDATISSREDLFEAYVRALSFPGYFGRNWDAFIDCLSDLSWLDQDEVRIVHEALPRLPDGQLHAYLECLMTVLERLQPNDRPQVHVYFSQRDQEAIQAHLQRR